MPLLRRIAMFAMASSLPFAVTEATPPASIGVEPHTIAAEDLRIHAHFDSVLVERREGDTREVSREQRARRRELMATLEAYNARGVFPRNYDFPARAIP